MTRDAPAPTVGQVGLLALFVTALVTAQVTAAKVIAVDLPVALPVAGARLALPGAAVAYAVTFLASDCYTELYGRRAAQVMVNVAFAMNFVLLALVWLTIWLPAHPEQGIDPAQFEAVLGASTSVVLGSLLAYLLSQNYDVLAFEWLRERTDGDRLWLRNIGSTATSQALDTVVFVTVAFSLAPLLFGLEGGVPAGVLLQLIVGQYLLKLAIALLDTPFVYAIVGLVRRREGSGSA